MRSGSRPPTAAVCWTAASALALSTCDGAAANPARAALAALMNRRLFWRDCLMVGRVYPTAEPGTERQWTQTMAAVIPNPEKIKTFRTEAAFAAWMKTNHARETEVWVKIH